MKTHFVIGDPHARPGFNNDRADWIGSLIADIQPDVVINIGDTADMESLSSYDKGTRGAVGRSYAADVASAVEFNDRLWRPMKRRKRKMPFRVILEGNHEERIQRALDANPEYAGAIGFDDLQFDKYYDRIVRYNGNTPGVIRLDGVNYAHYSLTGVSGRPISGEHPAYGLVTKNFESFTVGHSHVLDFCRRSTPDGRPVLGLVAGCAFDGHMPWAGEANSMYWRGVVVCRNVQGGNYDPEFVSLDRLREAYGRK